ncbi:TRAP-type C4-dicarboxylate transport system, small permease component [Georgenia satyanarayanai]|uniref:TRAP-type C4-dicarboxylate transport system, small permease component n=1 Tax=Georgenia satyanarayanai TaxID=860221 RepID=A0A2Y9C0L0_9MICO|nr:TRAP transporter small permease [Georgenia satyanarayanai]PYF97266.1 TRAP-type C4-dicarboxylate transport system permease small subunit [Georgenia satyanarayanai]SSA46352.1 TRAP-type C4-dicarboxylate transport system, small permease component [Georgenia satyanarayanai]
MTSVLDRIDRVLAAVTGALLAALTLVVTFQVLGRYVPFIPRPLWTEEIARLLLAWMVFLGAAVVLRRSDHFVIDLIPRRVDARVGRLLQLLVLVLVAAVSVVLVVGGLVMAQGGLTRVSTASGLHRAWGFAALPVGGLFMVVFSVELAVRVLRRRPLPEQASIGASGAPPRPDAGGRDAATGPDEERGR